jgi:hypothetical protein
LTENGFPDPYDNFSMTMPPFALRHTLHREIEKRFHLANVNVGREGKFSFLLIKGKAARDIRKFVK